MNVKDCPHCRAQGYLEPTSFFVEEDQRRILVEAIHCLICGWMIDREALRNLMKRQVTAQDFRRDERLLHEKCGVIGCHHKVSRYNQDRLCHDHRSLLCKWQARNIYKPQEKRTEPPLVKIGGEWFERRKRGRE